RVAITLMTTALMSTTPTMTPIIIFFFLLNAISGVPSTWGLMLEEVAFTWKLIKQFHVRANQQGQHPNAETRILLTKHRH
ncbi:MAG TPA: hypothetical protein VFO72_00430, partial [Pyrinomonadaceae bacterium]|nr:hypothetical protein [Pyrinomonadaceae bacterium]